MPRILVVDDEAIDRELAVRCLESLIGVEIVHASDGAEALDELRRQPADLVLTDLRMPGMDGLELVGHVKADFPLTPVVLMTSKGSEEIAVDALDAGAASYVPKKHLKEELADTVEQVLDAAQTQQVRLKVLKHFGRRETRFELGNDIALISSLASYFQEGLERLNIGDESTRTQIGIALMEAMANAIIHGNLEVDSELRDTSLGDYYDQVKQRCTMEPYASRVVHCTARETSNTIEYVIEDEGPGFDHPSLPDPTTPDNVVKVRGRGLMLIRKFMDDVEFNDKGNRITMTKRFTGSV